MQDFKNLQVWQKAHRLVLDTYAKSAHFPREEQVGPDVADSACGGFDRREHR